MYKDTLDPDCTMYLFSSGFLPHPPTETRRVAGRELGDELLTRAYGVAAIAPAECRVRGTLRSARLTATPLATPIAILWVKNR